MQKSQITTKYSWQTGCFFKYYIRGFSVFQFLEVWLCYVCENQISLEIFYFNAYLTHFPNIGKPESQGYALNCTPVQL